MLDRIKMLLGILDNSQDELLNYIIESTEELVLAHCKIKQMPEGLKSIMPMICADVYRAKQFGQSGKSVKSLTQGERSVTYDERDDVLSSYSSQLKPFMSKRGRLPSELL